MKVYALSNKSVQEIIRSIDKKSNYRFPFIDPPENIEDYEKNKDMKNKEMKVTQAT